MPGHGSSPAFFAQCEELFKFLVKHPSTSVEVSRHFAWSVTQTEVRLRLLRRTRRVYFAGAVGSRRWYEYEAGMQVRKRIDEEYARKKRARDAERIRVLKAKKSAEAAAIKAAQESWGEMPPTRRMVDAANAQPIRPAGPRWVFDLGAAA